MFARLSTANIGVSTFPIVRLFYVQTDINARDQNQGAAECFSAKLGAPALRASDAWVVFHPNYPPFLSYHCCRLRVIYLRTILDSYAETP